MTIRIVAAFCCLLLLPVHGLFAQNHCGNGMPGYDATMHPVTPQSPGSPKGTGSIRYIPLKFHLISASGSPEQNWYAADTTLVDKAIDTVNKHFLAADIQFCKAGAIDRIVNDTFCNANYNTIYFRYKDVYADTTVIHVYIPISFGGGLVVGYSFGTASNSGSVPLAYGMSGPAVAIESTVLPTDPHGKKLVLAHELGHFFGLLHCNNYSYMTGYELANGSNGATTGDFCGDTPAEYGDFYVDSNCSLIPALTTTTDVNGDTLKPDPRNIMSNNGWSMTCRRLFTPDQISRIKYFHSTYLSHLDRPSCTGSNAVTVQAAPRADIRISPNPSTGTQQITINCAGLSVLRIDLYNISGQLVQRVRQEIIPAGTTTIQANLLAEPQGIYWYRIAVGSDMQYRKVVKL